MNKTYRNLIMWILFSLLFVVVTVIQTVFFGDTRFFGAKASLIPIVIVCISMQVNHEQAAFFCLPAALFWHLSGADGGTLGLVTLTVTGILAGYLCDVRYSRRLFLAILMSIAAVLLHEGALFVLKCYLEQAQWEQWHCLPITAALAIPCCPLLYLLGKVFRKAGAV